MEERKRIVEDLAEVLGYESRGVEAAQIDGEFFPIYWGRILGFGVQTMVIDVDWPFCRGPVPSEGVMVITYDSTKLEFFKELLGDEVVTVPDLESEWEAAKREFLEDTGHESVEEAEADGEYFNAWEYFGEFNLTEVITRLQDEYGCYVFFVPKMEKIEDEGVEKILEMFSGFVHSTLGEVLLLGSELPEITVEEALSASDEELDEKNLQILKKMIAAWKTSVEKIGKIMQGVYARPDIHPGQFMLYGKRVVCQDPVYI